ncbi:MAG: DUF433 domain-containing protein [Oscillatoriales cyanobacterium C42_A2020_001]|nr:DUF433 domain-containing protein [Leptolyngbyaceae cyanobacterium C42_A2020_001]
MLTLVDIGTLIVSTPEVGGGRPRITGTWFSVQQAATLHRQGLSPRDIVTEYPFLTLAQVYVALASYHANQEEIETYLATDTVG